MISPNVHMAPIVVAALRELDGGRRQHHHARAVGAHLGWSYQRARVGLLEARKRKLATFCARRCGWRRAIGR
jgi:hypothetical protein